MGIKKLNDLLKKKCPGAFIVVPRSYFKGKRIAIDSDNVLMVLRSRAHKEIVDKTDVCVREPDPSEITKKWICHAKYFVIELLKMGATPVFIFDGKHISAKSKTQQKRRKDKQKLINDAEEMKRQIMELDELERTPSMVTDLRKKMHHLLNLTQDDKILMMGILSATGIPVIRATGEGEQLCAMLCNEGKVDAVYSRDSDLIVFGCPLTITESAGYVHNPVTQINEEAYKCTIFRPILPALDISFETFKDLCIMAGSDFNDNMPHIGVTKAYDILKQCHSIDNLPAKYHVRSTCVKHPGCKEITEEYEDQTECLNYVESREILGQCPSETIAQDPIILDIKFDYENCRDQLEILGAEDWLIEVVPLFSSLPKPSSEFIPKPPHLARNMASLIVQKKPTIVVVGPSNASSNLTNPGPIPVIPSIPVVPSFPLYENRPSPNRLTNKKIAELNRIQVQNFNNKLSEPKTVLLKLPSKVKN